MFKYFLCILLLILLACNRDRSKQTIYISDYLDSIFIPELKHNITNIWTINYTDQDGAIIDLNLLRNNKPILILLFSLSSCSPCVSDYLEIFNIIGCDYKDQVIVI